MTGLDDPRVGDYRIRAWLIRCEAVLPGGVVTISLLSARGRVRAAARALARKSGGTHGSPCAKSDKGALNTSETLPLSHPVSSSSLSPYIYIYTLALTVRLPNVPATSGASGHAGDARGASLSVDPRVDGAVVSATVTLVPPMHECSHHASEVPY
eukprot:7305943-Pyramimonas_sp.AAC.1